MDSINGIKISIKKNITGSEDSDIESVLPVTAQNVQGVVINEILPNPNTGGTPSFDTDGNGTANLLDEYVEFFNTTGADVDISGWTVSDGVGERFTFPAGTTISANGHVTLVANWAGTLPADTFEIGVAVFNDGGDVIELSDGTNVAVASYGSGTGGEDFGSDIDGLSIQRAPDGSMTFVNDQTPTPGTSNNCFLAGTRILTEHGEQLIENIEVGDKIRTYYGELKAVKWVSIQTIQIKHPINPLRRNPVCFKRGSLGYNLPKSDLYTSPDHAMFVDGLLINAGALVNGINIISTEPRRDFKYYHIELDSHVLLVADGCPAESFLAQHEIRSDYDNAEEYNALYPNGSKLMLWPMSYARISSAMKVPLTIKDKIISRSRGDHRAIA